MKVKDIVKLLADETNVEIRAPWRVTECEIRGDEEWYCGECEYFEGTDGSKYACVHQLEKIEDFLKFEGTADSVPIKFSEYTVNKISIHEIGKGRRRELYLFIHIKEKEVEQ